MTNVLLAGFTSHWHRRKSSKRTTGGRTHKRYAVVRSVPSLWSGMREQSCSIPRGLKINKNSAEGEVFFVDFPSYRTTGEEPTSGPRWSTPSRAFGAECENNPAQFQGG